MSPLRFVLEFFLEKVKLSVEMPIYEYIVTLFQNPLTQVTIFVFLFLNCKPNYTILMRTNFLEMYLISV